MWRADALVWIWTATRISPRAGAARTGAHSLDRARIAHMAARIDKAAFTRADMVEIVGAQLPVGAVGEPRALIEAFVDDVGVRISAPREAHHREGHESTPSTRSCSRSPASSTWWIPPTTAVVSMCALPISGPLRRPERAIRNIAVSPFLVQPLQAPAGAGKTHSLKALRAAAHRANKKCSCSRPPAKPSTRAMQEEAGDRGLTVAKALKLIGDNNLAIDRRTVVVVDEASMVGTPS